MNTPKHYQKLQSEAKHHNEESPYFPGTNVPMGLPEHKEECTDRPQQIGWGQVKKNFKPVEGWVDSYIQMCGPGEGAFPVWTSQHVPLPCVHFGDLEVGEHFIWGDKEHVKLPEIGSGPLQFGSTHHFGFVNCIRVGTLQLSGMGPLVEVTRIAEVQQAA